MPQHWQRINCEFCGEVLQRIEEEAEISTLAPHISKNNHSRVYDLLVKGHQIIRVLAPCQDRAVSGIGDMNKEGTEFRPRSGPGFIILEGSSDEILLNALLQKIVGHSLQGLGFFVIYRTKQSQNDIIKDLVRNPHPIIAFRDIDAAMNALDELYECVRFVESSTTVKCSISGRMIHTSSGATIEIVAVGLLDDEDLTDAGLQRHSMEDYLLKLIAIDESVANWCSHSLKELRIFALKKLKNLDVTQSKTLLAALAMKKKISYDDLIRTIIETATLPGVIYVTADLLRHLRAVDK